MYCYVPDCDNIITSHGRSRCARNAQHFYKYIEKVETRSYSLMMQLRLPEDAGLLSRGEAQQSLQPVLTEEPLVGAQTEAEAD